MYDKLKHFRSQIYTRSKQIREVRTMLGHIHEKSNKKIETFHVYHMSLWISRTHCIHIVFIVLYYKDVQTQIYDYKGITKYCLIYFSDIGQ